LGANGNFALLTPLAVVYAPNKYPYGNKGSQYARYRDATGETIALWRGRKMHGGCFRQSIMKKLCWRCRRNLAVLFVKIKKVQAFSLRQ